MWWRVGRKAVILRRSISRQSKVEMNEVVFE